MCKYFTCFNSSVVRECRWEYMPLAPPLRAQMRASNMFLHQKAIVSRESGAIFTSCPEHHNLYLVTPLHMRDYLFSIPQVFEGKLSLCTQDKVVLETFVYSL